MRRREFLKRAGLSGAAGASAGAAAFAAQAGSAAETRWRMATSGRAGDGQLFEGAEGVARRVAELTDGRFRIVASPADEIVEGDRLLQALRSAQAEMACGPLDLSAGREPAFAFASGLPFGLDHRHQRAWMASGGGREAMEPVFADHGVVQLHAGATGAQLGVWSRAEIRSPEDLRGMKVGVTGVAARVYAALGAQPQRIAPHDILQALESGDIDAAQGISPHDDERHGFGTIARHYYYPGFWQSGPELSVLIGLARWRELPPAFRAALRTACSDTAAATSAQYDTKNPLALRRLLAEGVRLRSLPQPVVEAAEAAASRVYAELAAESPHWKRVYAPWAAFRDDQQLWARLAQYGFDSFAYSERARATKA